MSAACCRGPALRRGRCPSRRKRNYETPARPSEEDIKLAYDPNISYVIASLADNKEDIKYFRIKGGVVEKEELEIVEGF